jgi:ketosteroid isomerase-like protein
MRTWFVTSLAAFALAAGLAPATAQERSAMTASKEESNRAFIADAFGQWAAGKGDVFSLLADDVVWHITGNDPAVAQTHRSRQALMDAAAVPLRERLAEPLRPEVKRIWADGEDVIVHWDGTARFHDGTQYRNTYLWIMTVRDRRIIAVTAFLDNATFKAALARPAP